MRSTKIHLKGTVAGANAEADGWTRLTPANAYLAQRYLAIMQQMNRATYSPARPEREIWRMTHSPCEYFHFAGSGFEIVVGFKWIQRLQRFRVMSTGFVGAIDAVEALDCIAAKMRAFASNARVNRLIAVRPAHMDNPRIIEMYELLSSHPSLTVRGGHRVGDGEYLWIGFQA